MSSSPECGLAINQVPWEWMTRQKALSKIWTQAGGVASALHRYSSGMFGMRTMHCNCKYLLVYFRQLYVARDALSCKSTLGRDLCKLVQLGSGICLANWNCSKICEKLKNSLSTLAYIKVKPIERFFCISASPRQSCQHMFDFTCWKTA